MNGMKVRRALRVAGAALLWVVLASAVCAQGMFYQEVAKDGRIYVFAIGVRYDAWSKSGETGPALTRLGYGPAGETVVFDSEDAVNFYNFKHDKPGEVFKKPVDPPKSPYPAGKITGLVFGDFYWFQDHHDPKFDGQQGFWLRRAYLGYDQTFSETVSARLRFEMNSSGALAAGNITPFVKDAYVTWRFSGKQQARLGIQPSLTFDSEEAFWGLRHIEKTPADLYGIDASRDFGLTFSGPLGEQGLSYAAQFGNDAGQGSETDKFKVVRFFGLFEPKSGLRVEGVYDYGKRLAGVDRTTAKGLVGYKHKQFRIAAEFLHQERKSGKSDTPATKIDIWSGFGVWDFSPKKASAYVRVDSVKGKLGSTTSGLPGADGIAFLPLSTKGSFKTYIAGLEFYVASWVRISPNVELVNYDDSSVHKDVVPRLTFFWTW
jgi:Phosphate-selective porin O and P